MRFKNQFFFLCSAMQGNSVQTDSRKEKVLINGRELTHEDLVSLKKCREESLLYAQLPLAGLCTGLFLHWHRSGKYSHLPVVAVLGGYFVAMAGSFILGTIVYMPFCLRNIRQADMVDSALQERMRQRPTRLRIPDVGPNEAFYDPYLAAVGPGAQYTTYQQRREFSRHQQQKQSLEQQQQQQVPPAVQRTDGFDNQLPDASRIWQ